MWDDARAYDIATGSFTADLLYWESLVAERRSARVLDLACGTGRITLPLAIAGRQQRPDFRIVGLDRSASFLRRARERLATLDQATAQAVELVEGDMRHFAFDSPFDLIILGYNSFAYLDTIDDQLACLGSVRRHLAPAGRFGLDLEKPQLALLAEAQSLFPPLRKELDWPSPAPDIARFVSTFTSHYDAANQSEQATHFWDIYHADGRHERILKDLAWHIFFPRELLLLLRLAGLTPIAQYGSYDRTPFAADSAQYLWVMTASDV